MVNSKIVAVSVLLLVVAFGGGISYIIEKMPSKNPFSGAIDNPTGFVTKYLPSKETRELRIYADLAFVSEPGLYVDVSEPMESFRIMYDDEHASVSLGSLKINSPLQVEMEFRDYSGKVSVAKEGLAFSGSAGQVKYNSGYIGQESRIQVGGEGIRYGFAELSAVPKTTLELQNVTGTITVTEEGNRLVYTASNVGIRLDSFRGKIISRGSNSLILDGTGVFRTSMLLAPGS